MGLTKTEVLNHFKNNFHRRTLFCEYCFNSLKKTREGKLYCHNEMCLNHKEETVI